METATLANETILRGPPGVPSTLEWLGGDDGILRLLDQTRLPHEVVYRDCRSAEQVWEAIRVLCVRGAPAIGVAAAFGLYLGCREFRDRPRSEFLEKLATVERYLCSARPTAVNLSWAVARTAQAALRCAAPDGGALAAALLAEAHAIWREDAAVCRRIGEVGAELIPDGGAVLTHCNAGALATSAWGTALALLYVARERGKRFRAYADETRPLLQGARLTAFELRAAGIDVTVLCDNAAASLLRRGEIDAVIVGADRIAANGDTANKIGTYGLALAAQAHGVPLYVAAPLSTFDRRLASGEGIPIERRAEDEVRGVGGRALTPDGVACYNPAFDVTPAGLIRAIVTERGLAQPVSEKKIAELFG